MIQKVTEDLNEILRTKDLSKLIVKKVEVNISKPIPKTVDIDYVIAFLSRVLLINDSRYQNHEYTHGKKFYKTVKTKIIDGFKTSRDSSERFYIKCYNKTRQLGILDKQVLRLELVYTPKGVTQALGKKAKTSVNLLEVLTIESMTKLIERYTTDVNEVIRPCIRSYLNDVTELLLTDLRAGQGLYKVFLMRYDLIKYDYQIMRVAVKKFYKLVGNTEESANVQLSRIKKKALSDNIIVPEGTIQQLSDMFYEIRTQGINKTC